MRGCCPRRLSCDGQPAPFPEVLEAIQNRHFPRIHHADSSASGSVSGVTLHFAARPPHLFTDSNGELRVCSREPTVFPFRGGDCCEVFFAENGNARWGRKCRSHRVANTGNYFFLAAFGGADPTLVVMPTPIAVRESRPCLACAPMGPFG